MFDNYDANVNLSTWKGSTGAIQVENLDPN